MNDQINPETPENLNNPEPAPQVDEFANIGDVDISNKGQRVAVILVAIIILAAAAGGFMVYSNKARAKKNLETLKTDFIAVNNSGYGAFWKKAQIDLKTMKTNKDFQAKLTEYLTVSSVSYAKHVKAEALPLLETAIPKYKALEAAGVVIPEIKAVTFSLESLLSVWQKFTDQVVMYENYLTNRAKLDELGGKWMTVQQSPTDEAAKADAARYVKIVNCILGSKNITDYDPWDLSLRVKDTCAIGAEKSAWFKRVAFECLDAATGEAAPDALYDAAVDKYSKIEVDNQDTKSVFAVKQCLDLTREAFETESSDAIAAAWADYVKKKIALLDAIKKATESI
ncbi:MAG: hypothetical protein JXR91_12040 [Deltaproteobacteria bacterium]|nr:hypothetical protein [Deltaproteobacteria bacterium]